MVRNLTVSWNRPPLHAFNSSSRSDLHFIWFTSTQFSRTPRNHKRVRKVCSSSNVTTSDASLGNPVEHTMTWVGINSTYRVRAYYYSCFLKGRMLVRLGNRSIQLGNDNSGNNFTQKIMTRYIVLVSPISLPSWLWPATHLRAGRVVRTRHIVSPMETRDFIHNFQIMFMSWSVMINYWLQ